jgi:hypothetical protein
MRIDPFAISFSWAPAQQLDSQTIDSVAQPIAQTALTIAWDSDANDDQK